jgi:hypothetical protein
VRLFLVTGLPVPGHRDMSGDDPLDDLMCALRDECGLAAATLLGLRRCQMLTACGSFSPSDAPNRRWMDAPSLLQFLRSL